MLHISYFEYPRVNNLSAVVSVDICVTVWCNQPDTVFGKYIDVSAKLVRFPKSTIDSGI